MKSFQSQSSTTLLVGALSATATLVMLSTQPGAKAEGFLFELPKFGFVTSLDIVVFSAAIIAYTTNSLTAIKQIPTVRRIAIVSAFALIFGISRGLISDDDRFGQLAIGPELRGMIFSCTILLFAATLAFKNPKQTEKVLFFIIGLCLLRVLLDYQAFGQIPEGNARILSAVTIVFFQHYVAVTRRKTLFLALPIILLATSVIAGAQRSSFLILAAGTILDLLYCFAFGGRQGRARTLIVGATLLLAIGGATFDSLFLEGRMIDRLSKSGDSSTPLTSNYEHMQDFREGFAIALRQPFLGYGTGTVLPPRTIDYVGNDVPIHSPHLQSWVRFGMFGLAAYITLQIFALRLVVTARQLERSPRELQTMYLAAALAASSYLWGNWALPPFYMNYQESFVLFLFIGIAIGVKARATRLSRRAKLETQISSLAESAGIFAEPLGTRLGATL